MQDWHSPFYVADRVGRGGRTFRMVKLRSMVADADRKGGSSTAGDDVRITSVGRIIRYWKIDELSQLWNVLLGDMSLVGPRPQVPSEVATYSTDERRLMSVKPGITDFASIVFADEAEVLEGSTDPDLAYRELIWPWKSQLGLFYIDHRSFAVDVQLIALTLVRIMAKGRALEGTACLLERLGAAKALVDIARRTKPLVAC
jgi:lipopolysaccharide/colanic/teichoic acid biosynthesis glycosyltransferase